MPESRPNTPEINPWIVAIAVMLGTFMEVLDTTVVNVALPHIAGSLSATVDETTWVLTSYLVANAIILPMTGWLASMFGRKRFLLTCIVIERGGSLHLPVGLLPLLPAERVDAIAIARDRLGEIRRGTGADERRPGAGTSAVRDGMGPCARASIAAACHSQAT